VTDPLTNRSRDDSLPPAWLIATGIVVVLALIFFVGFGVGQQWGGPQWGPLAEWIAGAATLAAVILALRESFRARRDSMRAQRDSTRAHLARLVDHEVSRRRECITALGDLWGAIYGLDMDFFAWTEYLNKLPPDFNPREQRRRGPVTGPVQIYKDEIREEIRNFSSKWQNTIEPPLFVALLVLRGTALYEAVGEVNDRINEIKIQGLDPIREAVTAGRRPDTQPITRCGTTSEVCATSI
jgi:hypothetical protein